MAFLVLERLTNASASTRPSTACRSRSSKGEFVSLLGPSGCGKTTTLQMIAGFVEPTRRRDPRSRAATCWRCKPAKRGLGIVFQSYALFPHMTAAENVAFGLEMQGVAAAERDASASARRWRWSGSAPSPTAIPRQHVGRPAAARGARARAGDPAAASCCSTSRSPTSTPSCARRCRSSCARSSARVGTTTILVTHDQAEAMALVRPHRGDEPGPRRADRPAARGLRAAGDAVRRELPRQDQLLRASSGRRRAIGDGAGRWRRIGPCRHDAAEKIGFARRQRPRARSRRASSRAITGSIRSRPPPASSR